MKALSVIAVIILVGVGCRSSRVEVVRDMARPQHLTQREQQAVRRSLPPQEQTLPQPAITMADKYASICPYCDTVNISDSILRAGGSMMVSNQPITVIISRGVVLSTNAPYDGSIENWSLTYTCSNCREPYSDYRDQLTPKTRSIRLPIRE
jgi:hypothetical protein